MEVPFASDPVFSKLSFFDPTKINQTVAAATKAISAVCKRV
jgi:hypothetical protein